MPHRFFSRTGFVLWIAATISAICVLPYAFSLAPEGLTEAVEQTGLPIALLLAISILQSALFLGVMTFIGLWAARKIGLGAPLIESLVDDAPPVQNLNQIASQSVCLGVAGALVLIGLDFAVFIPLDSNGLTSIEQQPPAPWMGLLASLYGGIGEELQLRLFLFSLLAVGFKYFTGRLGGSKVAEPSQKLFWSANVVVALVFGLAHLPATVELIPLTSLIVVRAIVLNGIVGLIFGYLYWKKGIEMAMLCHFSADIVLHVLLPLVTS